MNIYKFARQHGDMNVDVSGVHPSVGATAGAYRVEAVRWCMHGHRPDRCQCLNWTVLVAPTAHSCDVVRRIQVTGWAQLGRVVDRLVELSGTAHVTELMSAEIEGRDAT